MRTSYPLVSILIFTCLSAASVFTAYPAHAGPIVFNFDGTATEISGQTQALRSEAFPRTTFGGATVGDRITGSFSLTDLLVGSRSGLPFVDGAPGDEADRFIFGENGGVDEPDPLRDASVAFRLGNDGFSRSNVPGAAQTLRSMSLELTDSTDVDSVRISIRLGAGGTGGNSFILDTIDILLTDSTGTAFPGSGGLSGNYGDALDLLSAIDLSAFDSATGRVRHLDDGRNARNEVAVSFALTSLSPEAQQVPEPRSLGLLLALLAFTGYRRCLNRRRSLVRYSFN